MCSWQSARVPFLRIQCGKWILIRICWPILRGYRSNADEHNRKAQQYSACVEWKLTAVRRQTKPPTDWIGCVSTCALVLFIYICKLYIADDCVRCVAVWLCIFLCVWQRIRRWIAAYAWLPFGLFLPFLHLPLATFPLYIHMCTNIVFPSIQPLTCSGRSIECTTMLAWNSSAYMHTSTHSQICIGCISFANMVAAVFYLYIISQGESE